MFTQPTAPGYAEYPPITTEEEERGVENPACIVSHPDAGGPCGEPAALEVWSLPFCERHGAEAKTAALEELTEDAELELQILSDAEHHRHLSNKALTSFLEAASPDVGSLADHVEAHRETVRRAYPPIEGRTDPETLAHDYDGSGDGPPDWWTEARWLLCKFMRQAHERHSPELVAMLEPLRERAAAQQVLAEDDQERRWLAPRRAAREAAAKS
jgi:hypothetical protein